MLRLRLFSFVLAVALGSCAKTTEPVAPAPQPLRLVPNPTGDCATPPGNGARPGTFPETGATWLTAKRP